MFLHIGVDHEPDCERRPCPSASHSTQVAALTEVTPLIQQNIAVNTEEIDRRLHVCVAGNEWIEAGEVDIQLARGIGSHAIDVFEQRLLEGGWVDR